MACRSPFSSKTPTGRRHSSRRLRPTLGSSGGVAQESSPCCPKALRTAAFFHPNRHMDFPRAVPMEAVDRGMCRSPRERSVGPRPGWAIHGLEGPSLPHARRTGLRSAAAFRKPQGPAAPAPDPDPGGRRTLAAKSKFPCFLTNCVINGIAPRGPPTARFHR